MSGSAQHLRPEPLDLDSLDFPTPPTFIPPSPSGINFTVPSSPHFNPPPSRPPTAPLPPVPGPSALLFSSVPPQRSRSKPSLRENRDSVASSRSTVSTTHSSPQTPSSAAPSLHRPSLTFSIDEHQEPSDDDILDGILDSKAPLEEDVEIPIPPMLSRRTPPRTETPRRESISLTSVAIPAPDSDTEPDFDALDPRAPSPDIATIIAATPRPRLATSREEPWEEDFIDDYGQVRDNEPSSDDFTFGYPDPAAAVRAHNSDKGVPDDPAEADADSDIDLHTSLPQLMLHHGFLSPHSKLLAQSSAPSPVPSPASAIFPTSDPLPRDTRDTPKRRVRHRDGKLLRGGIGLTTGLGWSDSEDEDAPSALTRRISSLNLHQSASQLGLSRASSLSLSTRTSTFSSSTRSRGSLPASARTSTFSSSSTSRSTSLARRTQSEHEGTDTEMSIDEFGAWHKPAPLRGKVPPTSWARRSDPTSRLSRAQSYSTLGRVPSLLSEDSTHSMQTTTSAETARSTSSLPLIRTRSRVLRDDAKPLPRTPSLRRSSSAASTAGVAGLPTPSRSLIRPRAVTGVGVSGLPHPSSRGPLSMQSTPQSKLAPLSDASTSTVTPTVPSPLPSPALRPLRLQPRQPVVGGDRAPVPVPPVLHSIGIPSSSTASSLASSVSSSSEHSSALSASTSTTSVSTSLLTPSSSASGLVGIQYALQPPSPGFRGPPSPGFAGQQTLKTPTTPMYEQNSTLPRRPRTGTGMVYRTTTYTAPPSVRASKIGIAL
ncbi:Ribosomal protein 60S [Mycena sanguinolenta]|uniref:Ribosomal protein 60S n=1 Tax=Mycena sanguinolenta TaxID=230812 RepID=A0A8H6Z5G7_9AGAR|nr:Ribosomal protein 60S [Mycena sanguinolenta]